MKEECDKTFCQEGMCGCGLKIAWVENLTVTTKCWFLCPHEDTYIFLIGISNRCSSPGKDHDFDSCFWFVFCFLSKPSLLRKSGATHTFYSTLIWSKLISVQTKSRAFSHLLGGGTTPDWPCHQECSRSHNAWPVASWWGYLTHRSGGWPLNLRS